MFWCCVVFALAVLLTALNTLPPVSVQYRVSSELIVSPARLQQLRQLSQTPLESQREFSHARITGLEVLDEKPQPSVEDGLSEDGWQDGEIEAGLVLIRLHSVWKTKCTQHLHTAWVESMSNQGWVETDSSAAAREHRIAQWELRAAQHYLEHENYLRLEQKDVPENGRRVFQLAGHSVSKPADSAVPGRLASTRQQLEADVLAAMDAVTVTEQTWREHTKRELGLLEIASLPVVRPVSGTIPVVILFSMIALGLASGALASWFRQRQQVSGPNDPQAVAAQLELAGIPVQGRVCLPAHQVREAAWLARARSGIGHVRLTTAHYLTQMSEWIVGIWAVLILIRILVDPLWRSILIDNPLAAFGRIVAGLP